VEKVPASRQATSVSAAKAARRGGAGARHNPVSAEERERMIAAAAYYRAERRSFAPDHELEDWYAAETEIDRQIGRG